MEDLTQLEELNEATVLHQLRERFAKDDIYTYIGPMIVSVNPFKRISKYDNDTIPQYATEPKGMPPHLFATAQLAYQSMVDFSEYAIMVFVVIV